MINRENEDFVIAAEFQVLRLFIGNPELDWKEINISSFPHKKARALYKAISLLHDSKESITEGSLLREANKLDDTIDADLVRTLLEYIVDLSSLNKAVEELKEGSIKYKIDLFIGKIKEKITSSDSLDHISISSLLYEAQDTLITGGKRIIAKSIEECLSDYEEELHLRKLGKYYPFFDTFLDRALTKKAAPGQIILIAGATGTGKSVYGLNIINGLINNNVPCIYFSPEMDEISTMDRFVAMRSGIPIDEWYKSGIAIDPLLKIVAKEKTILANKMFRFVDDPSIDLNTIRHIIHEFKMTFKTGYICVFVDLITQVKEFLDLKTFKGNLASIIEIAVNELNAVAKKENVCFVCIAQMNREADNTRISSIDELDKLRPTLNHVKNSNAMGERARTVVSVFRKKYYAQRYLPEDPETDLMVNDLEIQVLKQSMGDVGMIGHYLFNGPIFHLTELRDDNVTPDEN